MSMIVRTAGLLDSFQDRGRYGWRHLGINPGGAMDQQALQQANIVLNNNLFEAALELHFPAAELEFESNMLLALAGADFGAVLDQHALPLHRPFLAKTGSILKFTAMRSGQRAYLAVKGGWQLSEWLGSSCTHLQIQAGGYKGRALQKGDQVNPRLPAFVYSDFSWGLMEKRTDIGTSALRVLPAKDWLLLSEASKELFSTGEFAVSTQANRMGYRINGPSLHRLEEVELLSAGVDFGAIQLLPNGQLIILMADHQVTGGYPVIAYVLAADLPRLAQWGPGKKFTFSLVDMAEAEKTERQQTSDRRLEQYSCAEKWKNQKS